jgi:hypothetical protein
MRAEALLAANSAVTVGNPLLSSNDFTNEFTTKSPDESVERNDDESLAAEKNTINEELGFSIVIVLLFFVGVIVNVACLVSLRRHRSTFHRFLKMLATFDVLVVSCIFLMYALPVMSPEYKKVIYISSMVHLLLKVQRPIDFL